MKKTSLFLVCFLFFMTSLTAFANVPERDANYAVTDLAGLFDDATTRTLINQNNHLFDTTGGEIAFLTVDTIPNGQNIEDFAHDVFNQWGVGSVENNNGVLVVISDLDGLVYITIGQGLEPYMSNAFLNEALNTYFIPNFEIGEDSVAALELFDVLSERIIESFPVVDAPPAQVIDNTPVAATDQNNSSGPNLILILVGIFVLFLVFGRRGGRRRRASMMHPTDMMMGGGRRRGGFGSFMGGMMLGNMLGGRRNRRRRSSFMDTSAPRSRQSTVSSSQPKSSFTRSTPPSASTTRGAGAKVNPTSRQQNRSSRSSGRGTSSGLSGGLGGSASRGSGAKASSRSSSSTSRSSGRSTGSGLSSGAGRSTSRSSGRSSGGGFSSGSSRGSSGSSFSRGGSSRRR